MKPDLDLDLVQDKYLPTLIEKADALGIGSLGELVAHHLQTCTGVPSLATALGVSKFQAAKLQEGVNLPFKKYDASANFQEGKRATQLHTQDGKTFPAYASAVLGLNPQSQKARRIRAQMVANGELKLPGEWENA